MGLLAAGATFASDFATGVMVATFKIYQWMNLQVFGSRRC